jgi:hypothetical protein
MFTSPYELPVFEIISEAWSKVKGAKIPIISVVALIVLCGMAVGVLGGMHKGQMQNLSFTLVILAVTVVQWVLIWGVYYLGLVRATGKPIQFKMIENVFDFQLILKLIGLFLLEVLVYLPTIVVMLVVSALTSGNHSAVVAVGMPVFYLAGCCVLWFLLLRMILAKAIILAERKGPWYAIKKSFAATKSNVLHLFGLCVIFVLITLIGALPLGIGLIWALPTIYVSYGILYQRMVVDREVPPAPNTL